MSTLLRLPLTMLAVLAALFFLPGVAFGGTPPTAEQCAADPTLTDCPAPVGGDVADGTGQPTGGDVADGTGQPTGVVEQPGTGRSQGEVVSAPRLAGVPAIPAGPAAAGDGAGALVDTPAPPPGICSVVATFPTCPGAAGAPEGPITCDQLAVLLGGGAACPDGLSCEQLADLLGVTCPAEGPTCEELAALFNLEGCPAPPTSCEEFADLLGIDNCSQIPCLDTSQLPAQARDGLGPLLDGLENIGITECPAKPVTGGGTTTPPGKGTHLPPPTAQQQPYYANCDDARAHGATNIPSGTPGYRPELDSDSDGVACESDTHLAAAPVATQPTGTLAYTGVDLESQLTVAWTLLMAGCALAVLTRRRA